MPEQGNDTSGVELDKLIEESYARKAEAEDVFSRHDSDESGTIDSKEVRPAQDSATSADPHGVGRQSLKRAQLYVTYSKL